MQAGCGPLAHYKLLFFRVSFHRQQTQTLSVDRKDLSTYLFETSKLYQYIVEVKL